MPIVNMISFRGGEILCFDYTNYKSVKSKRRIIFQHINYGSNEWYPDKNYFFVTGIDIDKAQMRSFCFDKIENLVIGNINEIEIV